MEEDRRSHRRWYWLLLVPMVGLLIPPIYNSADPTLIGIPFFYWYQLAWVPISVAVTALVYVKTRSPERKRQREQEREAAERER